MDEDVFEWWDQFPTPASRRTWQLSTCSFGFTAMNTKKEFWNLPSELRKTTEARQVVEISLPRGQESQLIWWDPLYRTTNIVIYLELINLSFTNSQNFVNLHIQLTIAQVYSFFSRRTLLLFLSLSSLNHCGINIWLLVMGGHTFHIHLFKYIEAYYLYLILMQYLLLRKTAKLFSQMPVPYCISTSNKQEIMLLNLANRKCWSWLFQNLGT